MNYHINRWILLMVITTAVIITTTGLVGAITVDGSKSPGEWDESWVVSTDPLDIITSGIPSGMDIEKLYAHYDSPTDTLYLMLTVYGIPGDLDGNGDIGSSCIDNGDCLGDPGPAGTGIGPQEFIYVFISPILPDPYFVISCNNNIITTVSSDETFPFSGAIKFAYESQSDSVYEISIEGISDYFGNPIFDENLDGTWDKALRITVNSGGSIDTNPEDNINAIIYNIDSPSSSFTVGQGASPAIKQLFIDAYNRNGGVGVLGEPESDVHEAFGLYPVQNFPGVPDIHGGVLMYNSIQNNVSYIHGAIWERYYIFQDKAELGPVKEDEKDAAPSQLGTTGRYSKFETGTIHWISNETGENENNPNRGESFVTYGDLDKLYTDMGGTYNNWLGFPVKNQEVRDGYGYCEFEGGYIEWDETEGKYKAFPTLQTITITSPNGGEEWQADTTQIIQWSYTGNLGSDVKIEILKGGEVDQSFTSVPIGSGGSGSYNWKIASTQSPNINYQVRISSTTNSAYSDVSEYFYIYEGEVPFIDCETNVLWSKIFPFYAESIQQTSDGGLIFAGHLRNLFLTKTDSEGNVLWTYRGAKHEYAKSVQQTSDGGYILAGSQELIEHDYNNDALLIKIDSDGNEVWKKTFEKTNYDEEWLPESVQQTLDGGYIVGCKVYPYGSTLLIKTDSDGNKVWDKSFGEISDKVNSVKQTSDGGYIYLAIDTYFKTLLIKTDFEGNEQWKKTFGGINPVLVYSIEQTSDGGYILVGESSNDAMIIKTDSEFNEQWNKTFGGEYWDSAFSIKQTSDGGYILAGFTRSFSLIKGISDAWIIKTDSYGNEIWSQKFGGGNHDRAEFVEQASDGGYIFAGYTAKDFRSWLIKVNGPGSDCRKIDINIKGVSLYYDYDMIELGSRELFYIDIKNLGQDIYDIDHDIYIRLIAGDRYGNHNVLQEEKTTQKLTIASGESKTISHSFDLNSFTNDERLIMVDAIEVEIISNSYNDNDLSNNIFLRHNILTLIDNKVFIEHLLDLTIASFNLLGVPFTEIDTFMETDPELIQLKQQIPMASGDTMSAFDVYCKFFNRLIIKSFEFLNISDDPIKRVEFISKLMINFIEGLWDLGKTLGFEIAHIYNMIDHFTNSIPSNDEVNIGVYMWAIECPVDIEITNENLQRVGFINGQIINNMENSYVRIDGDKKSILVFDDLNSNYIVRLMGTDEGIFSFYAYITKNNANIIARYDDVPVNINSIGTFDTKNSNLLLKMDFDGDEVIDQVIAPTSLFINGNENYNITFYPPITTMDQFNLTDGITLPIKFTAKNSTTDEFIYDDTVNVTITNSTGYLITYFTNGTGTDSVRINSDEEQYIVNFHSKNYDLNVGEAYTITVNFGELDSLRGYDMTYFRLVERGKGKG